MSEDDAEYDSFIAAEEGEEEPPGFDQEAHMQS
jgi:hypothetical protein